NGLSNVRGAIAMARTSDLDSATSQFYVNTVDNAGNLDGARYCAFGHVVEGMDVIDKIRKVRTTRAAGHADVPVDDVVILSIRRAPGDAIAPASGVRADPRPEESSCASAYSRCPRWPWPSPSPPCPRRPARRGRPSPSTPPPTAPRSRSRRSIG